MRRLIDGVLWPAVLGNIFWATGDAILAGRLHFLWLAGAASIWLGLEFHRSKEAEKTNREIETPLFMVQILLGLAVVVLVRVCLEPDQEWRAALALPVVLGALLVNSLLLEERAKGKKRWRLLACSQAIACVAVSAGFWWFESFKAHPLLVTNIAVWAVLVPWLLVFRTWLSGTA